MTSPSISSTSGTPSRCTPFCKVDWSREGEVKGRTDNQCSAQLWTRWTFNFIKQKLSTIWKTTRIAPYKHIWKRHDNTVFWCNLKTAQRKGLRFYQTRSHAITLSDTLPAMWFAWKLVKNSAAKCISHTRLLRVTLVPNLQHVQKDLLVSESTESNVRDKEFHHRRTCDSNRNENDLPPAQGDPWQQSYRFPQQSDVEPVHTNRKEQVRRFIEQFENHPNRNMLLKDYEKSEEIHQFSEESKNLITEMCNNEIFEFYETSLKKPCPDCALCWEIGIVYCTCGNACSLRKEINRSTKNRCGSLSIPGYAIKKTNPEARGMVHQSVRNYITKHVMCWEKPNTTILKRCQKD